MKLHTLRRRKRYAFALLAVAVAAGICAWAIWSKKNDPELKASAPVNSVVTEEPVLSVTLSLTGKESEASLDLFSAVCRGLDVKPCLFVTTEWLGANSEAVKEMDFAEWGLLVPDSLASGSKNKVRQALEKENERFVVLTGKFPYFARAESGEPSNALATAFRSFGQICVGSSAALNDPPSEGAIVDCGTLNGTTGYALAKFYAAAVADKTECVSLSELIARRI